MVEPTLEADASNLSEAASEAGGSQEMDERLECCRHLQPHPIRYRAAKRGFDIIGALVLLVLLTPVFLVIAVIVAATSPGPIFYRSTRIGLCGRKFPFIKFRSMRQDADKLLADLQQQNEKDGPIFKMKNDPRITPIGRFIRKYSLDELPQIYSVLIGDMSLVGPRPPIIREVEQYTEHMKGRLLVKPGISCYWQIMGRSNLTFEEWVELDLKYIQEMSFTKDLIILLKTPGSVLKGDGAY